MNNIKALRKVRGLTQVALAEMAGTSQPHILRAERGDMGVTLKVFADIAAALDVPLSALFADDLSVAEAELLKLYRSLPESRRQGWQDVLALTVAADRTEDQ